MKKIFSLILFITSFFYTMVAETSWYKYPIYSYNVDKVVDTKDKVYYLSNGSLFSFSPVDNESYAYNSINTLNDENVKDLYYNSEKDYVVVIYNNSNIDIIFDDGNVVNMPDIKDSSITADKTVNDVAFGSGLIVVATNFGIVVFDEKKLEVKESGIFNKAINLVEVMSDHILIFGFKNTEYSVLASPVNTRHNTMDKFKKIGNWGLKQMFAVDDSHLILVDNDNNKVLRRKVDFENYSWVKDDFNENYYMSNVPVKNKSGWYGIEGNKMLLFNATDIETVDLPAEFNGKYISFYDDKNKIWVGDSQGISNYDISSSTPTVLFNNILYEGCTTDKRVGFMRWSDDGERLYISNLEFSAYRMFRTKEGSENFQTTNIIESNGVRDVSLIEASGDHVYNQRYQPKYNNHRMYGDPLWMIEDPDDKDKYFIANYFEGVYVVKRNPQTGEYEEIGKFTDKNAPFTEDWGQRTLDVNIDREGNLWVGCQRGAVYHILPAAKRKADPKTITAADWKSYKKLENIGFTNRDLTSLMCKKSNMVFLSAGGYEKGFVAIDTKGTYDNPNDDTVMLWSNLTDQDGNNIKYIFITFIVEDQRGCVWVGTNAGIFEIADPTQAVNPNMRIRRIKVPRNDGTNYADYLLESEVIYWIAVDPADRKWVATEASGIYLISENGEEILAHYDVTNSPLPSNMVSSIECSKKDNTVYVGTSEGLYSFLGDASPGMQDYSDIYAYPNPVRPEYSGIVTITGLMDNTIVKITDTVGNVVYETRSEGGMATWDACHSGGDRVKSGVYYVYAASNNGSSSSGAVTKIMVIN